MAVPPCPSLAVTVTVQLCASPVRFAGAVHVALRVFTRRAETTRCRPAPPDRPPSRYRPPCAPAANRLAVAVTATAAARGHRVRISARLRRDGQRVPDRTHALAVPGGRRPSPPAPSFAVTVSVQLWKRARRVGRRPPRRVARVRRRPEAAVPAECGRTGRRPRVAHRVRRQRIGRRRRHGHRRARGHRVRIPARLRRDGQRVTDRADALAVRRRGCKPAGAVIRRDGDRAALERARQVRRRRPRRVARVRRRAEAPVAAQRRRTDRRPGYRPPCAPAANRSPRRHGHGGARRHRVRRAARLLS